MVARRLQVFLAACATIANILKMSHVGGRVRTVHGFSLPRDSATRPGPGLAGARLAAGVAVPTIPSPTLGAASTSNARRRPVSALLATTYSPVFDFSQPNSATKTKSASSFERIDDAIMGGISTSSLRDVPDKPYALWSGVCRLDGGGFCGARTLPFASPVNATGVDGVYLDCNLVSDDEAERRVWKLSLRTDSSRSEIVYQAEYDLKRASEVAREDNNNGWARVMVPFDEFRLVRGPRLVSDGPKIDVTGGIYQIGMTLSKFKMAENTTELENFRPGFFEMRIQRIGFYGDGNWADAPAMGEGVPNTLTKEEAERKRPLLLKMLIPVARVFFSEQAQRRKSAMRILREERELSRAGAILFGVRSRRRSMGTLQSILKTLGILSVDAFRAAAFVVLKFVLVYPLRVVKALVSTVRLMLGMEVKTSLMK